MASSGREVDAVVVGSGPNGLAAAVTLAAAGLRVHVVEAADDLGGGCKSEQLTLPGFVHDVCAAGHPMAAAAPFFQRFDLGGRGVQLLAPPISYANPLDGGQPAPVVRRSVEETAAGLGADAAAWQSLFGPLVDDADRLLPWLLAPQRRLPTALDAITRFAVRAAVPVETLVRTRFVQPQARSLLAGAAAHAVLPMTALPTSAFGLLLTMLAHSVGWPVVEDGSGQIVAAMVQALRQAGATFETGHRVTSLSELPPARAVLLDLTPHQVLQLAGEQLPERYARSLRRFRRAPGSCKVDFALSGPVPWRDPALRDAGTVHLGGDWTEVAAAERAVADGRLPDRPYVIAVQPGAVDTSRAPAGSATLWTYCHVPYGCDLDMADAIEAQVERFAPGFRDLVLARSVRTAVDEERHNPNLLGGDITGGATTAWQLVARPALSLDPWRTPLGGVYLCSSSTPPGPGVHGECGWWSARSALRHSFGIREAPDLSPAALPGAVCHTANV